MKIISFSSRVKDEIFSEQILSPCCIKAQAYGLVLFGRTFSYRSVSISTEHKPTALLYSEYIHSLTDIIPQIEINTNKKNNVKIKTSSERIRLLAYFGHSQNDITLRVNRANISGDCCFGAFIRGAFLSCGTVTSPEKNYHLEFVLPHLKICLDMIKLFDELNLKPKYVIRKGSYIVYFKDSESIEDILTIMGATKSSLELMGIKMQKSMRNTVNRKVNFEVANLSRTVEASRMQTDAINRIDSQIGLNSLPKQLLEIAVLRRDNPEISLKDLGEQLEKPISRSGINHRLKKIIDIAEGLNE